MNRLQEFCDKWAYLFLEDTEPSKEEVELFHKERKELNLSYIEVVEYILNI